MKNDLWLNLPSKNLSRTREFFSRIGFQINEVPGAPSHMVSLKFGDKGTIVNFFEESLFREFIGGHAVADGKAATEVLLSVGANSEKEVDAMADKVLAAGGALYAKPGHKDGWMYGCGFVDPDGHRWNILFMDMSKFPG